jgi:hypothetical protein
MRTLDTLEFPRKFARFMMAMEVESVLRQVLLRAAFWALL